MALRQVYDDNGTLKSKDIAGSGSANAADTVYDNSNTGLPSNVQGAIDKTTGNISSLDTVELTATAAHAHAADSTFLWIGQLVKVTTAIAVGDTIAVGTNVTNTDICSVLSELNSNLDKLNEVVTVTGESTDTFGSLLGKLYASLDIDRVTCASTIVIENHVVRPGLSYGNHIYQYSGFHTSSGIVYYYGVYFTSVNSSYWRILDDETTENYTNTSASGKTITFIY